MSVNLESIAESGKVYDNSYDEVPYVSHPYAATSPYHLHTIGTLFGMNPPKIETARILELGCAAGGNLIPHAINFPKANFLGVDLSKVQIDEANKHVAALSLKNIEFRHCSITDIDESFGKFDYIICHGVISWVPKLVQDKILEVSNKNLSENGIAYISYNTLPGWNMIRTIRDMMLYHSSMFPNVQDKLSQSRLLLDFVKDSLEGSNSPYAQVLTNEASLLAKQNDHYLRHDHLEENNVQYYFHDFMNEAQKNDLRYLADSMVSTMYIGNMPPKVVDKLKEVNDIVRTEQYMDYITNRRFRSTLLCHSSVNLNRIINNEDITKFNMMFNIVPEKPITSIDLNSLESEKFFYNGNKDNSLSSSSPYMKAILYTFSEHVGNPMSFDQIITDANRKLHGNKLDELNAELLANAVKLVLQGYITITTQTSRGEVKLDKPKASKLVIYQVTHTSNTWVTNLRHEAIAINLFEKYALQYMDGKNDKKSIIELIIKHVDSGEIVLSREDKKIEEHNEMRKEFEAILEPTLVKFVANAILV
jgi:methyltransferase-like protein/cyclopropane fatty-acyl-phospholipid synthase-like methyltransferase